MLRLAILGYGTVGSGVYEVIKKNGESYKRKIGDGVEVSHILDVRDFSHHENPALFTKNFEDILADPLVTVVAETIGGIIPAYEFTKRSLMAGKHVVTSNKELVATHGAELLEIANKNNVNYLFEASVGGGIPIIRPLNQCLAANEITEIMGILNGTTNYILTEMIKNGQSFDQALKEAQDKGYAERNPAADVEGHDTCRKIAILSSLVFGKQVDYRLIDTEGITKIDLRDVAYADHLGMVIKLIGYSSIVGGKVFARVCPMLIADTHPLASVEDVFNAILVKGDAIGEVMFYGKGAGKMPTASAVVADVIDIARNIGRYNRIMWGEGSPDLIMDIGETKSAWLIRVKDKPPHELGKIIEAFGDEWGVVTPVINENECKRLISGLPGVIKCIRIKEEC